MPVVGRNYNFTQYSLALQSEVFDAIKMGVAKGVEIFICSVMGDPNPSANPQQYSSKRCFFRHSELMIVPKSPASMQVQMSEGAGWMNDGDAHAGSWYHVFAATGGKTVTLAASHPTLDRYDVIYAVPKFVGANNITRQVVDAQGNVSNVTDYQLKYDDFDLLVAQGTAGAGFPQVSGVNINRATAYQYLPAGQIPISVVKVRAGATTVINTDLTDLRELFIWRTYPISYNEVPADVQQQLGILWPNSFGMPYVLLDAAQAGNIPFGTFYIDKSGGSPGILKFRKLDGAVVTPTVT
ncbi:hypothetical protein IT570_03510 [Candidatus Sumerlaeota bacterium]|nr:hypothetical protein [Candidatus Sumerlaeota bacterium]